VVRRSERAFSTCLRKVMSEAKSIRDRLVLATAMLQIGRGRQSTGNIKPIKHCTCSRFGEVMLFISSMALPQVRPLQMCPEE
jgi:hypothetical protein